MDLSVLNNNSQFFNKSKSTLSEFQFNQGCFRSSAGCDITVGARVNLLYEMPLTLLATRFTDSNNHGSKFKIMIHELNGCIVGPGLYQEWTNYVYAARNRHEQNLELCRSVTNNMLYYQATRPILKGDQLLAWYSPKVEGELSKSLLNREAIHDQANSYDTQCKHCLHDFEHANILKSHLLFDLCGQRSAELNVESTLDNNHFDHHLTNRFKILSKNSHDIYQKLTSTTPPSSSACSTSSSCSSTDSPKLFEIKREAKSNSAFLPIFNQKNHYKSKLNKLNDNSSQNLHSTTHTSFQPHQEASSASSNSSLACSPVDISSHPTENFLPSRFSKLTRKNKEPKKAFDQHQRVESYIKDVQKQSPMNGLYDGDKKDVGKASKLPKFADGYSDKQKNGIEWKITMLDGTQTVELNMSDDLGKQKKTHVCLFCGKVYNRKYGLKIHLRTHTGYKPLKCKVCSRPFSDPSNLNKHVRLHSQGDTPYRCLYCGKILVRKRDLDRHILSRHSGKDMGDQMEEGKFSEEMMMDSGNTDEDQSDLEDDLEDDGEMKLGCGEGKMFGSQVGYYSNEVKSGRSYAASPVDISIQKIIESSQ